MNRAWMIFVLSGMSATAGSSVHAPLVGVARDSQGQLRVVCGMAGNFIPLDRVATNAVNWAFTDEGGLVQTDQHLLLLDANGRVTRTSAAPRGGVLLAPGTAHTGALYFLAGAGELWQAGAQQDRRVPLEEDAVGGQILALGAANRGQAQLAVCRGRALWLAEVDLRAGKLVDEKVAGGDIGEAACKRPRADSLLLLDGKLVFTTAKEIIVQSVNGAERTVAISGTGGALPQVRRAGNEWVEVEVSAQPPMMVHLARDGERVFRLPAAEGKP